MYQKYARFVYFSEDDDCWIAVVPDLPGCQADGDTVLEASVNADRIIEEWIETAIQLGREIPKPLYRLPEAV